MLLVVGLTEGHRSSLLLENSGIGDKDVIKVVPPTTFSPHRTPRRASSSVKAPTSSVSDSRSSPWCCALQKLLEAVGLPFLVHLPAVGENLGSDGTVLAVLMRASYAVAHA